MPPPVWAVGMSEQPDGTFKLSLLDDEPAAASPPRLQNGPIAAAPRAGDADRAADRAAQRRHQRTLVVFGVVTASAVALLLGHMRALQDELVQFKREMTPLRTEVSHLRGNVAALLQGDAKVSAEQIGELLALRQEPAPAQTCAEYVPRPVVADSPLSGPVWVHSGTRRSRARTRWRTACS